MRDAHMLSRISDIYKAKPALGAVCISFRCSIHDSLNTLGEFIISRVESHNLTQLTVHHRNDIGVFARLNTWFATDEPIQFIQFMHGYWHRRR